MKRTSQFLLTVSIVAALVACDSSTKDQAVAGASAAQAAAPASQADATAASAEATTNADQSVSAAAPANAEPASAPVSASPPVQQAERSAPQVVSSDPPSRVARLAYIDGDVQFSPAGETQWDRASRNRPLVTGDRLLTGGNGRAAMELGDLAVRIGGNSAFNLLSLDDRTAQIQLSQGTLHLRVRNMSTGENDEVDTPTLAFVANRPGDYRIDVASDGSGTTVTVIDGGGTVYGENGVSKVVEAHRSYQFADPQLAHVTERDLPAPDDFDRYSAARESRYSGSVSRRHVSAGVIGYDDLDDNGDWQATSDHGDVWYPRQVARNWAPYRDGHWEWVDPYGWTWVDNAQWGFAPYHYGRWVRVSDRWGWIPGAPVQRAVYAPALVVFVGHMGPPTYAGGNDEPVGWFPLGPRDVYLPPYRVSRNYFTNVNVTNISVVNKTVVNNTVINNYYNNYASPNAAQQVAYAYRTTPQAVTVVPRGVFAGARPVQAAVLTVQPAALKSASVASAPHVAPAAASLGFRPGVQPASVPNSAFNRVVMARNAPPPPPVPFAAREKLIAAQNGAPVAPTQLRQIQQARAAAQPVQPPVRLAAPGVSRGVPIAGPAQPNATRPMPNAGLVRATGAAPSKGIAQTATASPRANENARALPATAHPAGSAARPAIGSHAGSPQPVVGGQPVAPGGPRIIHAPMASDRGVSNAGRAANGQLMQQRAAQERAQANQARASQVQARNAAAAQQRAAQAQARNAAAAQQRASQVQARNAAAAQQRASQVQARNAAAAQQRPAQAQPAQRAAAQQRAAPAKAQNPAKQEHAAHPKTAQGAATQKSAARPQAQNPATQKHAAQTQVQRAGDQPRPLQGKAPTSPQKVAPNAKKPQRSVPVTDSKKRDSGDSPPVQ